MPFSALVRCAVLLIVLCIRGGACGGSKKDPEELRRLFGKFTDKLIHTKNFEGRFDHTSIHEIPENITVGALMVCSMIIGYCIGIYIEKIQYYAVYIKRTFTKELIQLFKASSRLELKHSAAVTIPR
ncbi:hypothetical protein NEMIN01_0723 [Nematocida minor]|uniref:uncharacterized protein n=1 Tax=Nematocida minor TaxID=1912983 RepID=UPI002220C769|nr:uncharacterized protein NEMIN01_0723 [Nematocida minor]KAI5189860.1 hypothetical protein NEMIN01_0723 [Nematocida minor]